MPEMLEENEALKASLEITKMALKIETLKRQKRDLQIEQLQRENQGLRDSLYTIACKTTVWTREEMIDEATAALVGKGNNHA